MAVITDWWLALASALITRMGVPLPPALERMASTKERRLRSGNTSLPTL